MIHAMTCKSANTVKTHEQEPTIHGISLACFLIDMGIKLNENALKSGGGNEWEMVKTTLLIRFCQIYSNSLPEGALSFFNISKFEALGSEIWRLLPAGACCLTCFVFMLSVLGLKAKFI